MRRPLRPWLLTAGGILMFSSALLQAQFVDPKDSPDSGSAPQGHVDFPVDPRSQQPGFVGVGTPAWGGPEPREEEPFTFSNAVREDNPLSLQDSDLSPVPEPATVLLVTVVGMLTLFRRRSRPR